jgi:glycerol-3-phosphate O-acyltransferase / dihydroxyacetone phosphate acyltransferase
VLYRLVRAVISFALGMFYRTQVTRATEDLSGPIMLVGNHPNSIIDPALVFVITQRKVTFLAREPLFRVPVFGFFLRRLGALPVFRKQDHPAQMTKNEGTLDAAADALKTDKAITIFPEGKSHSEPQLTEIKTGAARIAYRAAKLGAKVRIVPVGLTYQQKHRFRSRVLIQVGQPISVDDPKADEVEWVRTLTEKVATGMRDVTLNLQSWNDLALIETAEQLYALRIGEKIHDPERQRRFARGIEILSRENPELLEAMRDEVMSFRTRLELVAADPKDLSVQYRRPLVAKFIARNIVSVLFGLPLFLLGLTVNVVPFMTVRLLSRVLPLSKDRIGTFKFFASFFIAPIWTGLLGYAAYRYDGLRGCLIAVLGALPLALFTRYFVERWRSVLRDMFTFFTLGSRSRLKERLLLEGERLAAEIEKVAVELKPRTMTAQAAAVPSGTAEAPAAAPAPPAPPAPHSEGSPSPGSTDR